PSIHGQFPPQLWAQAPLRSPLQPAAILLIRGVMSIGSVLGYAKPGIRQSQGARALGLMRKPLLCHEGTAMVDQLLPQRGPFVNREIRRERVCIRPTKLHASQERYIYQWQSPPPSACSIFHAL